MRSPAGRRPEDVALQPIDGISAVHDRPTPCNKGMRVMYFASQTFCEPSVVMPASSLIPMAGDMRRRPADKAF